MTIHLELTAFTGVGFGLKESISSVVVQPDGKLFCGADIEGTEGYSIVCFKVTPTGQIDTSFDGNGYKVIASGASAFMIEYENDYLIVGEQNQSFIVTKIDGQGTIDTTFGNNGFRTIQITQEINILRDVKFLDNKLYLKKEVTFGANASYSTLLIYDLSNESLISSPIIGYNFDYAVTSDGIYIVTNANCPNTCPGRKFTLFKYLLDGTPDTNFHINGVYEYAFPYNPAWLGGESSSTCVIRENDRILLGGYFRQGGVPTKYLCVERITEGTLGVTDLQAENIQVFPNPFEGNVSITSSSKINKLEVYDLLGRIIATPEIEEGQENINVNLSSTIQKTAYIIKIYTNNGNFVKRLIRK